MERYPVSLATLCDPAELKITAEIPTATLGSSNLSDSTEGYTVCEKSEATIAAAAASESQVTTNLDDESLFSNSSMGSSGSHRKQPLVAISSIVLPPDTSLYMILDNYYPKGMTVGDAFIVEPPAASESSSKHPAPSRINKEVPTVITSSQPLNSPLKIPAKQTSPVTTAEKSTTITLLPRKRKKMIDPNVPIIDEKSTKSNFKLTKDIIHSTKKVSAGPEEQTKDPLKKSYGFGVAKIFSHIKVLVVEDNLVNQKIMARHLKSCHIGFSIATNGKEALEMWKLGGYHLCFMDMQLPVMSGIEVIKEIRKLETVNKVGECVTRSIDQVSKETKGIVPSTDQLNLEYFRSPIIIVALTASTGAKDKQRALAAGCNDYLTKPVQLKWLKNKLTEWGCMQSLINYDYFRGIDKHYN